MYKKEYKKIIPSLITLSRPIIACWIIDVSDNINIILISGIIALIILLDAVDGCVARKLNSISLFGSFLDIACDRMVEFVFLFHFSKLGYIPLTFTWLFYIRVIVTDYCRFVAFKNGKVEAKGIILPQKTKSFVLSEASRSLYAIIKMIMFIMLFILKTTPSFSAEILCNVAFVGVIAMSLIRAYPIIAEYWKEAFHWRFNNDNSFQSLSRIAYGTQFITDLLLAWAVIFVHP